MCVYFAICSSQKLDPLATNVGFPPCVLDPQPLVVVFTRIPKCASTQFLSVATPTAKANGVHFAFRHPTHQYYNLTTIQKVVNDALKSGEKTMVQGHNFHPNIYDPRVAYINFVREPYQRCRSFYTFMRFDARFENTTHRSGMKTFAECVKTPKCSLRCGHSMASHFCTSDRCPLDTALYHLERTAFVGDSSNIDESLELLEQQIPSFFKGMSKMSAKHKRAGLAHSNSLSKSDATKSFNDYTDITNDLFKAALGRMPDLATDDAFYDAAIRRYRSHRTHCLPPYK